MAAERQPCKMIGIATCIQLAFSIPFWVCLFYYLFRTNKIYFLGTLSGFCVLGVTKWQEAVPLIFKYNDQKRLQGLHKSLKLGIKELR